MSSRFVRSPETPKITITHGSADLSCGSAIVLWFYMSTELVSHRGQQLVAELRFVARAQPCKKRGGKNIGRNAGFNRADQSPAAFAGIIDIARIARQLRIFGQR